MWRFVFCWFGFVCLSVCFLVCFGLVFCRIVYETGKAYRNILALISVLVYAFPIFQRPDQPVLPLRPDDARHVPSQLLHRQVALCTFSLVPENMLQDQSWKPKELFS